MSDVTDLVCKECGSPHRMIVWHDQFTAEDVCRHCWTSELQRRVIEILSARKANDDN
jgi:hypothetical protein